MYVSGCRSVSECFHAKGAASLFRLFLRSTSRLGTCCNALSSTHRKHLSFPLICIDMHGSQMQFECAWVTCACIHMRVGHMHMHRHETV